MCATLVSMRGGMPGLAPMVLLRKNLSGMSRSYGGAPDAAEAGGSGDPGHGADLVDDLRPEFLGQVVPHTRVGDEPGARDAGRGVAAARGLDQRVVLAGDDQRGRLDRR